MVETLIATMVGTAAVAAPAAGTAAAAGAAALGVSGATAATAGLFGTAGAFSFGTAMSTLGTGFSLLSGLGQIGAGQMAAGQYEAQAKQEALNSRLELVRAEDQANEIRRNLIANIGTSNATFASRGIGLGSGTPEQAKREGGKNAAINIDKARFGGDWAAQDRLSQAGQLRGDARASRTSGYFNAIKTLTDGRAGRTLLNL